MIRLNYHRCAFIHDAKCVSQVEGVYTPHCFKSSLHYLITQLCWVMHQLTQLLSIKTVSNIFIHSQLVKPWGVSRNFDFVSQYPTKIISNLVG